MRIKDREDHSVMYTMGSLESQNYPIKFNNLKKNIQQKNLKVIYDHSEVTSMCGGSTRFINCKKDTRKDNLEIKE